MSDISNASRSCTSSQGQHCGVVIRYLCAHPESLLVIPHWNQNSPAMHLSLKSSHSHVYTCIIVKYIGFEHGGVVAASAFSNGRDVGENKLRRAKQKKCLSETVSACDSQINTHITSTTDKMGFTDFSSDDGLTRVSPKQSACCDRD